MGEGLTPAGDDCLVGTLAVIQRFDRAWLVAHPEIQASVRQRAWTGTTVVAREFIVHALAGHFAESVVGLLGGGLARGGEGGGSASAWRRCNLEVRHAPGHPSGRRRAVRPADGSSMTTVTLVRKSAYHNSVPLPALARGLRARTRD
ncbi:MAG TPA: DUF2877 domain-containing protein [Methylomirabilota bacterium]|nr:DUF2877 domain-containing protein [Methylomirabilota bacterium]